MNPAYGQSNSYWSPTATELQYSPLMQTIPTMVTSTIKTSDTTSPPLFRPYNHYPLMGIKPHFDILKNKTHKSAFKPVVKKSVNKSIQSAKSVKGHVVESSYYNMPNVILANDNNCFRYGQAQFPIPYEPLIVSRGSNGFSSPEPKPTVPNSSVNESHDIPTIASVKTSEPKIVKNLPKPIAVCQNNTIHTSIDNAYQWNPLILYPSEPLTKSEMILPQKKSYTRKRRREYCDARQSCIVKENEVPIIDLTSNEDECTSKPLDINGNEILITTNTKPVDVITCKKTKDLKFNISEQQQQHLPLPMEKSAEITSNVLSTKSAEKLMNSPILMTNLTQNGCRMPPKEQLKFVNKYNRWMRYFRVYNGFRFFAQQNYAYAQQHTNKTDDTVLIQSTLVKWWNALPPLGKEQYAKMAETIYRHKLSTHTNANGVTTNMSASMPMLPISDDSDTNTNTANDVHVNQNKTSSRC
ncbi:uncharacterized protein LOC116339846 [Contarinia nasturtii]|uniref:uncharacterized protein LOC116339846 n=1 Tax=Contarinia nasturtii TaxID=265458 RepID=UPI0012D46F70|nr:uncharacterized protein LOC116339846 [Contarinia nasturtii]